MSVNRYRPHLFILPEDDANRQLANGFALEVDSRQIQVLTEAGGWLNVREKFDADHVQAMRNFPQRSIVLLIDFDEDKDRRRHVNEKIPHDLADRVFLIGTRSEPEDLRRALAKTYEDIGRTVARDCRSGAREIMTHELLQHNQDEFERACASLANVL